MFSDVPIVTTGENPTRPNVDVRTVIVSAIQAFVKNLELIAGMNVAAEVDVPGEDSSEIGRKRTLFA